MDETKKSSVLIVDDETSNLKILTHILSSEYAVYTAKDGPTALEIAKKYAPDLILLDVIMPEMSGCEVFSALKACDKTSKIPVIIVTGLDASEDKAKELLLEAEDYINKPFSADIVRSTVRGLTQTENNGNMS